MEKVIAVSTANAGAVLQIGPHRLWVDAVHNENTAHFSIVTEEMFGRLLRDESLRAPEAMLFTHAHNDHFSRTMARKALEEFPETQVFIEGNKGIDRQVRLKDDTESYALGDLNVTFFRLPHDGEQFKSVKHYGILLEYKDTRVLFPGDTHVGDPALTGFLEARGLKEGKIDLAFFNFPWVALNTGRSALLEIGARHIVFFHLPFDGEDGWGYRKQVFRLTDKYKEDRDWRIFSVPFQREEFE